MNMGNTRVRSYPIPGKVYQKWINLFIPTLCPLCKPLCSFVVQ
jgi:hypothetical protein